MTDRFGWDGAHLGRAAGRALAALALATALGLGNGSAQAAYPERPITFIVPFAPAGPADIIARILATAMSQTLGQNIIIDNRAGGTGNVGIAAAARATPDGYTLLLTSTAIAVNQALFKNLSYDPIKDFVPITELVNAPNVLFVNTKSDIKTVADLVAQAKASPNKFNYASPGHGTKSHLAAELFKLRAGVNMVHVPFRGGGPATQAVVAETTQVGSVALAPVEPLVKGGQLRALAVTGAQRWYSLPDVPTMIESGFPGFVSDTFNALFAPAGVPKDIIEKLSKEARAAMQRPEVRDAARNAGYEIVAGTPEQLGARLISEIQVSKELAEKAGVKAE